MKVKTFIGTDAAGVDKQVNDWLATCARRPPKGTKANLFRLRQTSGPKRIGS